MLLTYTAAQAVNRAWHTPRSGSRACAAAQVLPTSPIVHTTSTTTATPSRSPCYGSIGARNHVDGVRFALPVLAKLRAANSARFATGRCLAFGFRQGMLAEDFAALEAGCCEDGS
jgi:hypothetical protein